MAATRFAERGADVIDTDTLARDVVAPGSEGLAQIRAAFGTSVLTDDGRLDRAAMRELIFYDARARERLEAITHPLIEARVQTLLAACQAPYAVLVVPLLLERGWQRLTDRVVVVDCPVELQRQRLHQRDNASTDEVDRILSSQLSRERRLAAADDVLTNDGSVESLKRQVDHLDSLYRRYAHDFCR